MFSLFISESSKCYPPLAEYYAAAKCIGPLASFDVSDSWVDHPYQEGVALIGDAAATTDPTFGQGLSLALRDGRVLRDELSRDSDWVAAGTVTLSNIAAILALATPLKDGCALFFKTHLPKRLHCDREPCRLLPKILRAFQIIFLVAPICPSTTTCVRGSSVNATVIKITLTCL